MSRNRVDVHTHLVPPFWAEELKTHGGDPSGWGQPQWSPESLLAFMKDEEIAMSFLSLTAPGVEGWKDEARVDIVRRVNDYGAGLVRENPKQFGYLATLALPDIEAGLAEIKRSYDELHVDGVVLHSNYEGVYLADPHFDPIWKELELRSATIFIHPTRPVMPVLKGMPSPLLDYPADTTRCAFDLILNGHRKRFPSTKVILSHAGGYLPFVASRLAELTTTLSNGLTAEDVMAGITSFYFDTALTAPSGLPSLLAVVPNDHIVFGTDYPYASEKVSKSFDASLDNAKELGKDQIHGINIGAARLFPRLNK